MKRILSQNEHDAKDVLEQIEADLTAPDPGLEEEVCTDEWCAEPVFRDGPLCLDHLVIEETAAWDDRDVALDGAWWGDLVEVLA